MNIGIAVSNSDWRKQSIWKQLRDALAKAGHRASVIAPDGKWTVFPGDVELVVTNNPRIASANVRPGCTVTGPHFDTVMALADGREVPVQDDGPESPEYVGDDTATPEAPTASKAAVSLAEAKGLDLSTVVGTGKDGQVTKPDVVAALATPESSPPADALSRA